MSGPPEDPAVPDWDALAPFWHHFEHRGFGVEALSRIEGGLIPPCLYLGAGLGTYPARLADTLGSPASVVMVDASLAMLRRRIASRVPAVCADGVALPFGPSRFACALVATGIIELVPPEQRVAIVAELLRVVRDDGVIVIAVPARAPDELRAGVSSLDAWLAAADTRAHPGWGPYDAVAETLGDRRVAHRLLSRALPGATGTLVESELRANASTAGAMVTARMEVGEVTLYRIIRTVTA